MLELINNIQEADQHKTAQWIDSGIRKDPVSIIQKNTDDISFLVLIRDIRQVQDRCIPWPLLIIKELFLSFAFVLTDIGRNTSSFLLQEFRNCFICFANKNVFFNLHEP